MKLPRIIRKIVMWFKYTVLHIRPDPKKYSTIVGAGSIIPCQQEAYFLCLKKYLKVGDSVLDVGFGLGYGMNILSIRASKVYGVDVDPLVLKYCQDNFMGRNPKLMKLMLYDGINLKFKDNTFDVVSCVDVLEHVEDYHSFLDELLRVSKRGVFISTPNRREEYTNPDGTPKNRWHLREWNRKELSKILEKHGRVEWNFLNGPFKGPFTISDSVQKDTLTLSPFIYKK